MTTPRAANEKVLVIPLALRDKRPYGKGPASSDELLPSLDPQHLADIRLLGAFSYITVLALALAQHARSADAANVFTPRLVAAILAHPANAFTDWAVMFHAGP